MKNSNIRTAIFALIMGTFMSGSAFARLACDSAASNVNQNGGSCTFTGSTPPGAYPAGDCFSCHGASGADFNLVPGTGPTGCSIVQN